ncbi:MAG: carboxypeptidase regulatory-like domain-containing protein [Planctomycetes bacterium]|nr:carboxypeptidase regulatory-like domain-containing protein [Planctomycetota bacterium]
MRALRFFVVVVALVLAARLAAGADAGEQAKLDALDAAIDGTILYTQGGRVYTAVIGTWTPVDLGDGNYARWSPDGQKIAVLHNGNLYVMDADGGNRTLILSGLIWNINPIDYHANGTEILFTQNNYGLRAVDIATHSLRDVATFHKYFGEPAVCLSGERMVARQDHWLYAITPGVGDREYTSGACSPGISPCGAYVMNNTGTHTTLEIRDWDGSNKFTLDATTCQPDGEWDNQHWSNHPDYIAVQGEVLVTGEVYIMHVSANDCTRVTWVGNTRYPDLYVENVLTITGTVTDSGSSDPVANRIVRAANGPQVVETQTNENGEYMIVGILAGDYTISMPGAVLAPTGTGTQPVTVSGADVTGADFEAALEDNDAVPDGIDDAWEYKFFGDITTTDGTGDADSDNIDDMQEYIDGTNPTIPESTGGGGGGGCGPVGGAGIGLVLMIAVGRLFVRRRGA